MLFLAMKLIQGFLFGKMEAVPPCLCVMKIIVVQQQITLVLVGQLRMSKEVCLGTPQAPRNPLTLPMG